MPKKKTTASKSKKSSKKVKFRFNKKQIIYGIVIGAVIVSIFIVYMSFNNIKTNSITSFEQCVDAGNPIRESYPRQCAFEGKTFIEKVN